MHARTHTQDYAAEQLCRFACAPDAHTLVTRLHGLLTLSRAATEPKGAEARRRLPLFVNSLFMAMPSAPSLQVTL